MIEMGSEGFFGMLLLGVLVGAVLESIINSPTCPWMKQPYLALSIDGGTRCIMPLTEGLEAFRDEVEAATVFPLDDINVKAEIVWMTPWEVRRLPEFHGH